jgi:hypothetical protein
VKTLRRMKPSILAQLRGATVLSFLHVGRDLYVRPTSKSGPGLWPWFRLDGAVLRERETACPSELLTVMFS